ncbi:lipopolysaccharide heptosyltransferase II [Rhodoferax sp.]|uniref:lipopolysaccharide heptosyltransferase II n=1 Tax=Rhodoferax sp. TaxID=50421 RepID=UPI002ACD9FC3|nr:lipopolysaccharide heptosyltransferase II [Rhodoferax sp.]MDZ7922356.1 lipopolysaccharide heptosyltransferase II [Rhodoferax sp.]
MNRSLVIAPQWIGDAVMTEPLMRRLQARGERLTVGALPWVAPVYRAMPQVAEVIEFPFAHGGLQWAGRRAMAKALRGRFDAAYVCPNSLKSALIPWWAGIPRCVGYSGESRWGLINQRLPNPPEGERPPMVAFYSALSGETGLAADRPQLQLAPGAAAAALAAQGLAAQGFYVLAPGAEFGPAKRWPAAHFAELARQLALPVLLLGSGKDAAVCAEIASTVNAHQLGHCVDLAGKTSLDEAIALIASAKAMVSNDSGLMHVAAAFGVPQVAVFGSSSPLHTPPLSDRATVLWLKNDPSYQPPLDCAPCFARDCPLGHTRCLNDIAPARVLSAL